VRDHVLESLTKFIFLEKIVERFITN